MHQIGCATRQRDRRRGALVAGCCLPRDTDAVGVAAPLRAQLQTQAGGQREREPHPHICITTNETAHACAWRENCRSSAAPSFSPLRSSSVSLSFRRPFPSCFFSLPTSPVGLPHGQRIRKRGYTRWINFIGVSSLSLPLFLSPSSALRPVDDYIGIVPCYALLYSLFRTLCTGVVVCVCMCVFDKCSRRKLSPGGKQKSFC